MPHAIADVVEAQLNFHTHPKFNPKSRSREARLLSTKLEDFQSRYETSQLAQIIDQQLRVVMKNAQSPINKVLSLGLGSLVAAKGQSRRLKQLAILLAVRDILRETSEVSIQVYAQDPSFTRKDDSFLESLGIHILRTPSGSELGEASTVLDTSTLVYSPFLTLEAYGQLLGHGRSMKYLFGDDFDALLHKWPKQSAERVEVEEVVKNGLGACRRRPVVDGGF
ncbi:hypothetical protein G6011_07668 [Alternaria panax]|uniref:SRR1-like domain-containing protein n=1 Tax=Alternaria panax TaxID=48097 RepID=A0AAD4F7B5_9PLEO|nr:hypothetical protein G6011_07668 [Alternaria panax]